MSKVRLTNVSWPMFNGGGKVFLCFNQRAGRGITGDWWGMVAGG